MFVLLLMFLETNFGSHVNRNHLIEAKSRIILSTAPNNNILGKNYELFTSLFIQLWSPDILARGTLTLEIYKKEFSKHDVSP